MRSRLLEQAADVIKECAALDGVAIDADLPVALAEDLAEGSDIRPPELQIVCTALVSNPTIAEYRLRGGARRILSHHIQSAIAICDDPKFGSQILRALCNFPAHSKHNPQTVTDLLSALDLPSSLSHEQATKRMETILVQFEVARLVLIVTKGDKKAYALVHDYLVDAVDAATSEEKNLTERANKLLQYYAAW